MDGSKATRSALSAALSLSRDLAAHVTTLHVRADPRDAVPLVGEGMSGAMVEELIALTEAEIEARGRDRGPRPAGTGHFDELTSACGVPRAESPESQGWSVRWQEVTGREDDEVANQGRLVDLIAIGRPGDDNTGPAVETWNATLFESGRPVLVVPPGFAGDATQRFGRRIAIAWNGSSQAARAVTAALPLLHGAETISVLTTPSDRTAASSGEALVNYLAWHGLTAGPRVVDAASEPVGQALMDAAAGMNADLVVMGAYTHSRLVRLILGGVTRTVLERSTVPVLMAH